MEACNPLYNHHHHPCSPRSIIPLWHFGKLSLQRGLILPSVARPFLKREELLSNCNVVWLFTSASSAHSTLLAATKAPKKTHHGEKSLVKVLWNVKADLEDGQQLFVSGSDTLLGSWDPELAIPMSYCEGKSNCWKTEVQVPRGTTFEYNYFVKCKNSIFDDVRWRFGPTLSLSLPSSKRAKKKVVKDGPIQISDCQSSDRNDAASLGNLFLSHANTESIQTSDSHKEEMGREVSNLTYQPIEEPWLSISLMPSEEGSLPVCSTKVNEAEVGATANNNDDDSLGSESNKRKKKVKRNSEAINSVSSLEEVSENGIEPLEAQTLDVHGKECKQKSDADIEIIVNSSVCTVQRIAVLEDGKPVELLLEPVKTNVQVGNIYLGIIRKLIPGMRGAFVDIGDRQLAFLAMSKNRKPFTFPRLEEEQVNGAALEASATLSYSEGRNINQGINNTVEDELSTSYADATDEYEVINDTLIETCNNEGNIADDKTFNVTENRIETQSYSNENEDTLTKIDCNQKSKKILREVSNEDNYVSDQWEHVKVGTKIIVQVIREALGTKGPTVTAFPCLTSRFWIVKELRLRDIGGIIVVDFIDMEIEKHKWMVYEEVKKAVEKDRSSITFSELSELGLMELTRKRVRPSLAFKITEACPYCQGCGRVEALDTTFSKIERAVFRILAKRDDNVLEHEERTKPRVLLRVDPLMHDYLISGKNKRIVQLSKALKTLILLKGIRSYTRGQFEVTDFKEEKSYHDTEKLVDIRSKKIQSGLQGQKLRTWPFKAKRLSN